MAELNIIVRAQNQASGVLNGLKRDLQSFNNQAQSVGTALSLGVTAPFTLLAKTGLETVAEFSRTMSELEVVTGASGDALATLNDTAIKLGAETSFSANEAAQAMLELSKAGMDTEDVLSSIPGVFALAAAGSVDLGYAANLTASSLNAFQLSADQSGYVANLLAAAANESSANISDLAAGLQQGGFAFSAANQDIDDLAASLAILTNVGLTGSDAGTALKNAFTRIMSPTKEAKKLMDSLNLSFYNANGEMKPMEFIIGDLNTALDGMTQQQRNATLETLFLSDGMKAMIPLLTLGQDGFLEMKDAVNQAGAAQEVADAKMRGLAGAFEYASGSIESALLNVFGPLEGVFVDIIKAGADFITWISQLPRPVLNAALAFTAVLAAAGPLLLALPLITGFISAMLSPIGLVVLAVAGLAAAWASNFGDIQGKTKEVIDAIKESISTGNLQPVLDVLSNIGTEIATEVKGWATSFTKWTSGVWARLSVNLAIVWTSLTTWIDGKVDLLYPYLYKWATEFWAWATEVWATLDTNLATMWESLTTWIDGKVDVLYTYLYKWATEFWAWAGEVWTELSPKLNMLWGKIQNWVILQGLALKIKVKEWASAFLEFPTGLNDALANIQTAWGNISPIIENHVQRFKDAFGSLQESLGPLQDAFGRLFDALRPWFVGLGVIAGIVIAAIGIAFSALLTLLESIISEIGTIFTTLIDSLAQMVENVNGIIGGMVSLVSALISGDWATAWESAKQILWNFGAMVGVFTSMVWAIMVSAFTIIKNTVIGILNDMGIDAQSIIVNLRNSLTMSFLTLKISVSNHIESMYNDAVFRLALMAYKAGSLAGEAKDAVIGKFSELAGAAGTAIDALRSTVESKFGGIKSWIEGLSIGNPFSAVVGWANSAVSAVQNAWSVINGGGGGSGGKHAAGTPYFRGGLTTINERGTELLALPGRNRNVWLPRGTSIIPAERVPMMAGAGGGVTVNLYATINNDMDAESIAWQVAAVLRRNQR